MKAYTFLIASFLASLLISAIILTSARAAFGLKPLLRPVHWVLLASIFYYDVGTLYGQPVKSISEAAIVIGLGLLFNPLGVGSGLIALWIVRDKAKVSRTAVISMVVLTLTRLIRRTSKIAIKIREHRVCRNMPVAKLATGI